jgi:sugar/nucleoside kinase (ribokinase family)
LLPDRTIRFDVLCYGTISLDNIVRVPYLPNPQRDVQVTRELYQPGGEAVNVGVMLAAWGCEVALIGNVIGEDDYGKQLITELHQHPGVDLRYASREPGQRTPFRRVLVTPDGERSVIGFWFDDTPKVPLTVDVAKRARLLSVDVYGKEERNRAACIARDCGRPVVSADVVWLDHPMLSCSTVVVNALDYTRERFPAVDLREHMRRLHEVGGATIITTLGREGSIGIGDDSQFIECPGFQVPVVDTSLAGEVFKAGVIQGYLHGWPLDRMMRFANAAAALKCSRESLYPPVTLVDVNRLVGLK